MDLTTNSRRETFVAGPESTVHLHVEHADVTVRHEPTEQATITVSCRQKEVSLDAVEFSADGPDITVRVPHLRVGDGDKGLSIDLGFVSFTLGEPKVRGLTVDVVLPEGAGLNLTAKSGDVRQEGRGGRVQIRTGAGDLRLGTLDALEADLGSGDVHLREAGDLDLAGGSGDFTVGRIRNRGGIRSGAGDLRVRHASGELKASSGSGDVRVELFDAGTAQLRTACGDVSVGLPTGVPIWQDVRTVSGDVVTTLEPAGQPVEGEPFITVRAATSSGDVTLHNA